MTPEVKTDKNANAIRDLIAVSRTLIDSQRETDARLRETGADLDARLKMLTENVDRLSMTVDRFLKGLQKPNGHQ
jgi:hypothetical protein